MTYKKLTMAGLLLFIFTSSAYAANMNDVKDIPMVNIENAIEADKVSVTGRSGTGFSYVVVKACEKCKTRTLKAQPGTTYKQGNKVLSPDMVALMQGKPATVIYSTETEKVTRVIYFEVEGQ